MCDEERSALVDPFLCCLFSAMVQTSVRTWHQVQKEISRFYKKKKSLCQPPLSGKHPSWELKCPAAWHRAKKCPRALRTRPPRPSLISCLMLESRFAKQTQVSTEGTRGSGGTSGSQMAKVQLLFTGTGFAQTPNS